jgi:hypothetical protein
MSFTSSTARRTNLEEGEKLPHGKEGKSCGQLSCPSRSILSLALRGEKLCSPPVLSLGLKKKVLNRFLSQISPPSHFNPHLPFAVLRAAATSSGATVTLPDAAAAATSTAAAHVASVRLPFFRRLHVAPDRRLLPHVGLLVGADGLRTSTVALARRFGARTRRANPTQHT